MRNVATDRASRNTTDEAIDTEAADKILRACGVAPDLLAFTLSEAKRNIADPGRVMRPETSSRMRDAVGKIVLARNTSPQMLGRIVAWVRHVVGRAPRRARAARPALRVDSDDGPPARRPVAAGAS